MRARVVVLPSFRHLLCWADDLHQATHHNHQLVHMVAFRQNLDLWRASVWSMSTVACKLHACSHAHEKAAYWTCWQ
jgi:hypothetical protein